MQTRRENSQQQMTLLPPLESFIPDDHPLRKLNAVLDLSFIHKAVRECYCQNNGRPSIDPEVIIRLFLIQAIEGIPHVRDLMRQVQVNLAYRWFIGYELHEDLPDHSSLSKALSRLGDNIFNELFEHSIAECKRSKLIDGKVLHVDATTIRADIDKDRVNKPESSDKDARFGRFPDGTKKPGYKQQTVVDDTSRVILEVSAEPANISEGSDLSSAVSKASARLDSPPEVVCADTAYASGKNAFICSEQCIQLVSPPAAARNHHSHEQFTIEQFEYDDDHDLFICPTGKKLLKEGCKEDNKGRWKYRASVSDCRCCPRKPQCTRAAKRTLYVSGYHGALVRLRKESKTVEFKALYRRRAPVIEGIFAESKQWHGLARAWRRGLRKMRIQCLLIASVINFKRLMCAMSSITGFLSMFTGIMEELLAVLRLIQVTECKISPACVR